MKKDELHQELSKCKSFLSLVLCIAVANICSSLNVASSTPTIESLADGIYFYGKSYSAKRPGSDYVLFQKQKKTLTGVSYTYPSDRVKCFQGKVVKNKVTKPLARSFVLGIEKSGEEKASEYRPIELTGFNLLRVQQAPQVNPDLKKCIEHFAYHSRQ